MSDSGKLDTYLKKAARDLPAMPHVAAAVMRAVEDPNCGPRDLQGLIEQDAAIAARLLKVANSPLYGFRRKVESLQQAVMLLGNKTVKNLVLAASMQQAYRNHGPVERGLWTHATLAGPAASKLALHPAIELDKEEAFTAGLLHDIGKAALVTTHRDQYQGIAAEVSREKLRYFEAEQRVFGFDHAELGARVAEKWNLPERLVSVIHHHHDGGALVRLPEADARLTALIAVTTACLSKLGIGRQQPCDTLDLASLPAWSYLELSADDVEPILQTVAEQVKSSESLVG
jgi:putative nucleotidyltransferase with HDIG domain